MEEKSAMNSETTGLSNSNKKQRRKVQTIPILSAVTVACLAVASFSLSFEALRQLAVEKQVVSESLSWLFPCVVDGAIIVFSLAALRSSLRNEPTLPFTGMVILATFASVGFNIAHVPNDLLAQVLAATPPVLLFMSFEALMHTLKEDVKTDTLPPKNVRKPTAKKKSLSKEVRLQKVRDYLEDGMNASEIADKMPEVSLRTIQRDISSLQQEHRKV